MHLVVNSITFLFIVLQKWLFIKVFFAFIYETLYFLKQEINICLNPRGSYVWITEGLSTCTSKLTSCLFVFIILPPVNLYKMFLLQILNFVNSFFLENRLRHVHISLCFNEIQTSRYRSIQKRGGRGNYDSVTLL